MHLTAQTHFLNFEHPYFGVFQFSERPDFRVSLFDLKLPSSKLFKMFKMFKILKKSLKFCLYETTYKIASV